MRNLHQYCALSAAFRIFWTVCMSRDIFSTHHRTLASTFDAAIQFIANKITEKRYVKKYKIFKN